MMQVVAKRMIVPTSEPSRTDSGRRKTRGARSFVAETSVLLVLAVVLMFARQQLVPGFSIPAMTALYCGRFSSSGSMCGGGREGKEYPQLPSGVASEARRGFQYRRSIAA